MNKRTVIFVLGMHRSGTSALAGSLAESGAWLGENLLEPAPGVNDKGFWEDKELLRINEVLLKSAGLHWYTPFGVRRFQLYMDCNDDALQRLVQEARDFINMLIESSGGMDARCFAIKDPRLCITAPFWKPLFEEKGIQVAAIQLIRSPIEVARSLQKRDGIVHSLSHALWLDYVLGAYAFSQQVDAQYLGEFDELMASPTEFIYSASRQLKVELTPNQDVLNKWIQKDLRHQTSRQEQIDGEFGACVMRVYEGLLKGHQLDLEPWGAIIKAFEAVWDDLERQFSLYNKVVIQLQESNKQLTEIGHQHSYALSIINERDAQLAQLSNSLSTIADRNKEIAQLNERLRHFEESLLGRLHKVLVNVRTAMRDKLVKEKSCFIEPSSQQVSFNATKDKRPLVDVIIPVYRGLEETSEAVRSASATLDRAWARLVVINDDSPEPKVTQWLRDNQATLDFVLLENEKNLGFVGTVNKGMKLSPEADVLLLNSDVEVANNWLERLQDCAYSCTNVASVTATANNATICSFPIFCEDNELLLGHTVESIDKTFRDVVQANTSVEVPTGVGCCMYLRRDSLNDLGFFDEEEFGLGYGEENDWSQRAIKEGWKNLHALNVFVYHKGAVSFAEESNPRKEENLHKLVKRYPGYNADVQAFIQQDPAKPWRTRLLCELLSRNGRPLSVAISHGLGGGVNTHILELERELREVDFMLLEPVEEGIVQLILLPLQKDSSPSIEFSIPQDYERLLSLLQVMGVGHVHFHHAMGIPARLYELPRDLECIYDYTLHDYWVINGNPTLTDRTGFFAGDGPDRDTLCSQHYPLPEGISASEWRRRQLPLLQGARYLITPSRDTMLRIANEEEFCHLDSWMVSPHLDHASVTDEVEPFEPKGEKIKVVVLGALSREKGADTLEAIATGVAKSGFEFHLLGYGYRQLCKKVVTHGPYPEDEALERLLSIKPDVVWFTAQCPETYSYTLSIALKAKLPVVAPALGAFPERLAGRRRTVLLDYWRDLDQVKNFWERVAQNHEVINEAKAAEVKQQEPLSLNFYHSKYLQDIDDRFNKPPKVSFDELWQSGVFNSYRPHDQRGRERILALALALRKKRVVSLALRLVPLRFQRRLKRFLSRKPIHEIR